MLNLDGIKKLDQQNKKILINVSRSIIYAGNGENFVVEAVKKVDEIINSFNFT